MTVFVWIIFEMLIVVFALQDEFLTKLGFVSPISALAPQLTFVKRDLSAVDPLQGHVFLTGIEK